MRNAISDDDRNGGDAGLVDMPRQRRDAQRAAAARTSRRSPSRCGRRSRARRAPAGPAAPPSARACRPAAPASAAGRAPSARVPIRRAAFAAAAGSAADRRCGGSRAAPEPVRPIAVSNAHAGPMPGASARDQSQIKCAVQRRRAGLRAALRCARIAANDQSPFKCSRQSSPSRSSANGAVMARTHRDMLAGNGKSGTMHTIRCYRS